MRNDELFSQQYFHDFEQSRKSALLHEIQSYDMNAILQTPLEELAKYFEEKYKMDSPRLKSGELYLLDAPKEVSTREQVLDRSWGEPEYYNVDRSYIQFTVCVPFEGDASLFGVTPTSRQINMSRNVNPTIVGNELRFSYREAASGLEGLEKLY